MKPRGYLVALAMPFVVSTALAQETVVANARTPNDSAAAPAAEPNATKPEKVEKAMLVQKIVIQNYRPNDQRGINMFEPPKSDDVPFTGFQMQFGGAFTQQFQGIAHSNTAAAKMSGTTNANALMPIGKGFNNAVANLYVNAQLAKGIRVAMTSYLSSRHHQESWVKDGYLLIDGSPIDKPLLNNIMKYVTIRGGHFEINYGDAHFRRSDNGNAIYNPFVGNLILDAFTTEVGGEVYVRANGLMAMAGVTNGMISGQITTPGVRKPAYLAKVGIDKQLTDDVRFRLTGSGYINRRSPSNTLFAGDRAGSRYYYVLENTAASTTANFRSGMYVPGFGNEVTAFQVNPFVKIGGLELFGVIEKANGKASTEKTDRSVRQYAADAVYRFADDQLFVGSRYNTVEGNLSGIANRVGMKRANLSGGWFVTPTILLKGEYVRQTYTDFPALDIRNGGKFNGFVVEGVVAF
jgi:hypothetical protein